MKKNNVDMAKRVLTYTWKIWRQHIVKQLSGRLSDKIDKNN